MGTCEIDRGTRAGGDHEGIDTLKRGIQSRRVEQIKADLLEVWSMILKDGRLTHQHPWVYARLEKFLHNAKPGPSRCTAHSHGLNHRRHEESLHELNDNTIVPGSHGDRLTARIQP